MVSLLVVLVALCCLSLHCKAYLSFENATAKDEDGNIEVEFSLNGTLYDTDDILIYVYCHEFNLSSFDATCNSSCISNTTGSVIVKGPINAGETYACTVFGSVIAKINLTEVETNNFTSETGEQQHLNEDLPIIIIIIIIKIEIPGIPSSPTVECIIKTDDSLGLKVTSEHHGVPQGDPSLKINVTVDDVTYSFHYSSTITSLPNMNMTDEVTVWIINKYGQSQMVSEECEPPFTSSTVTSTSIVDPTSTSGTSSPTESSGLCYI